jgi:hypothetical protein
MDINVLRRLVKSGTFTIRIINKKYILMKVLYQITSSETGTVKLRRRKIAKALRRWLRERGIEYEHFYYLG